VWLPHEKGRCSLVCRLTLSVAVATFSGRERTNERNGGLSRLLIDNIPAVLLRLDSAREAQGKEGRPTLVSSVRDSSSIELVFWRKDIQICAFLRKEKSCGV